MTPKLYVGAHSSIAQGFANSLKYIDAIGGNAVQIFLKSPRGGGDKPLDKNDAEVAKNFLKQKNIFLIGHCTYLINFAKSSQKNPRSINSLIKDMEKIEKLGGVGVVLHIGKYLNLEKKVAFQNIKYAVTKVLQNTPKTTKILFENTAGQGTEVGFKLEELKQIYDQFTKEEKQRITFCLDTCHAFAAGYDLSSKQAVKKFYDDFNKIIGWNKIECIHLNDAQKECGSRKDRHEDITYGQIGKEGIKAIIKLAQKTAKPLILETPSIHCDYKKQISMIKKLAEE